MNLKHGSINARHRMLADLHLADAIEELIQKVAPGTLPRDAAAALHHRRGLSAEWRETKGADCP